MWLLALLSACTTTSQQVTGPGPVSKCAVTAATSTSEFSAQGGEGHLTVTAGRDCTWQVRQDAAWVNITSPAEMQGDGTVTFVVAATADPLTRSASFTIADQHLTITQRAAACRFQLSTMELSVPAAGAGRDVDVTASSTLCEWTAQADANWVGITTGRSYKGSARVTVQAGPWAGPVRRATVTVADQKVVLTQSDGCASTLTSSSADVARTGGRVSVPVQAGDGCGWSSTSNVPWAAITAGATGSGPGIAEVAVEPNVGPARSATVTIASHVFTINQAAGCEYRVDPGAWTVAAAGGAASITMSTAAGCSWTAESEAAWITLTSGQSGSGPGSVQVSVAANQGPERAAGIRAGGQRIVVTQATGCTYAIFPVVWGFPADAVADWVNVAASPICPWTATSHASWITVTAGSVGTGNGIVHFALAPNPAGARAGTIVIAGQTFTAIQAGR